MEYKARKGILIDLVACLLALPLAIYSLLTLKEPDTVKLLTAILFVGLFLVQAIRYGIRYRALQNKQKA